MTEFYRNYLAVAVLIGAAILMVGAMLGLGRLVRPNRPQDEKFVTYEAGSDPIGVFGQSNVRYYVYALLFVMSRPCSSSPGRSASTPSAGSASSRCSSSSSC